MRQFAKLFETPELGQILVKCDTGDDGYEVKFYFDPNVDGLGICSTSLYFRDDVENTDILDAFFESIDEEKAISIVAEAVSCSQSAFVE